MKNFEEIISGIPDKRQRKSTTSLVFKKDLWDFLSKNKFSVALEIGTAEGFTTRIISQFVNKIYTIDNNIDNINAARKNNEKYSNNITFIYGDAYDRKIRDMDIDKIDLCFIDAVHDHKHVMHDIGTAVHQSSNDLTIIFDDYGLFPEIKETIDNLIKQGTMDVVQKIGEVAGQSPRVKKTLKDHEGIICKLK